MGNDRLDHLMITMSEKELMEKINLNLLIEKLKVEKSHSFKI